MRALFGDIEPVKLIISNQALVFYSKTEDFRDSISIDSIYGLEPWRFQIEGSDSEGLKYHFVGRISEENGLLFLSWKLENKNDREFLDETDLWFHKRETMINKEKELLY